MNNRKLRQLHLLITAWIVAINVVGIPFSLFGIITVLSRYSPQIARALMLEETQSPQLVRVIVIGILLIIVAVINLLLLYKLKHELYLKSSTRLTLVGVSVSSLLSLTFFPVGTTMAILNYVVLWSLRDVLTMPSMASKNTTTVI